MAGQPSAGDQDGLPNSATDSLQHFQFTFNCSASNSGKNSFIEPDVSLELL